MEKTKSGKDSEYFTVWGYLLLSATHREYEAVFKGEKITLKPGQLITGRKTIAERFCISESKVQRIIDRFENEHQIERQTSNKNSLISIINWELYQSNERQSGRRPNSKRTTTEQQPNTNNNDKNVKNERIELDCPSPDTASINLTVIDYLNQKAGTAYRSSSQATQRLIHARQAEGFTLDDFKKVIDTKCTEWLNDPKMAQYLRPATLFGTKFESYLNAKGGANGGDQESAQTASGKYGHYILP